MTTKAVDRRADDQFWSRPRATSRTATLESSASGIFFKKIPAKFISLDTVIINKEED